MLISLLLLTLSHSGFSIDQSMDITGLAKKLGLADNKPVVRKAAEFRRLSDIKFDSSAIGVVCFSFLPL